MDQTLGRPLLPLGGGEVPLGPGPGGVTTHARCLLGAAAATVADSMDAVDVGEAGVVS